MRARKNQQETTTVMSDVCEVVIDRFAQIYPKISHRTVKSEGAKNDDEKEEDK
jgi:hypothetical protein